MMAWLSVINFSFDFSGFRLFNVSRLIQGILLETLSLFKDIFSNIIMFGSKSQK